MKKSVPQQIEMPRVRHRAAIATASDRLEVGSGAALADRTRSALVVLLLTASSMACSSDGSGDEPGGSAGTSAGGGSGSGSGASGSGAGGTAPVGGSSSTASLGTFAVTLNPAVGDDPAHTSIFGSVYGAAYPNQIIETEIASDGNCKVYKYSHQFCDPACTGDQRCGAPNVCMQIPSKVSVGDVTVAGVGPSSVKLSGVNNDYQNTLDLPYPGMTEGEPVTLTATGGAFSAFTLSAKGVAPVELSARTYLISNNQPLTINWTPGAASSGAEMSIAFNISKHGGSAGYMHCDSADSGALTISANVLEALTGLGVGGFPELLITRFTRAETTVSAGRIAFEARAVAKPALNIEGYCSCFNDSDCGSCTDKTKTSCDSVKKLCNAP